MRGTRSLYRKRPLQLAQLKLVTQFLAALALPSSWAPLMAPLNRPSLSSLLVTHPLCVTWPETGREGALDFGEMATYAYLVWRRRSSPVVGRH